MSKKAPKRASGTREWAETTVNCIVGCSHDCRYCYARYSAVDRFHHVKRGDWTKERVREEAVSRNWGYRHGVVMFPSAHDITPNTLEPCMAVLRKLIAAGNSVLVVTKPHLEVVRAICVEFAKNVNRPTFRFTIGSCNEKKLAYWEPGAPTFRERLKALKYAFNAGFKTSISTEPLLDPEDPYPLFKKLIPYVNGEFWVGKMRKHETRVDLETDEDREMLAKIIEFQTDEHIMKGIVGALGGHPQIRWKDSIKEVIERNS